MIALLLAISAPACSSDPVTAPRITVHVDSCGKLRTTVNGRPWRGRAPAAWENDSDHTGLFRATSATKATFKGDDKVTVDLWQTDAMTADCRLTAAN